MTTMIFYFCHLAFAMNMDPTPFPIFLRLGFSSILEFEEAPSQVVLGDSSVFQVEKLNKSIVIKPLAPYASTNMFVYFKSKDTRMFILQASEEAEPTYFKHFGTIVPEQPIQKKGRSKIRFTRGVRIISSSFNKEKDYFTLDLEVSADSKAKLAPNWDLLRLKFKGRFIAASKIWSQRHEVQLDSKIKARLVFTKPNLPLNLNGVFLILPVKDSGDTFNLNLGRIQ
jgi:hypothetical protein